MYFWVLLLFLGWMLGFIIVAASPSPYFAALGLVFVVGAGGILLLLSGGMYYCFVLTLVYLGGMLVVFAFTAAMAADPYPLTLGSSGVWTVILTYCLGCTVGGYILWGGQGGLFGDILYEGDAMTMMREDIEGVAFMYGEGGWIIVVCAWSLLLALFVVMEVIRGSSRGALRAM